MALLLPAIQGKLGDVTYYSLTMKARELTEKVVIPSEDPDWEHQELDLYFQRDINYKRIEEKVAPYFARHPWHFSSSIILALKDFNEKVSFTPLLGGLNQVGLVTIDGGCQFLPIDGQHRVVAIQYAIAGVNNEGRKIQGLRANQELAKKDVPIILVPFEVEKVRAIFSAVNEHAKRTTASENILVGDKLTQKLTRDIATEVFSLRLMKKDAKVLDIDDHRVTTLSSLENCIADLFDAVYPYLKTQKDSPFWEMGTEYDDVLQNIEKLWISMIGHNEFYQSLLKDKEKTGDEKRKSLKKDWLISRAIAQECLFKAFAKLISKRGVFHSKPDEAARALSHLPLKTANRSFWQPFLFSNNGNIVGSQKKFTAEFMSYLVSGGKYRQKDKLEEKYRSFFPDEDKDLPPPIV